MVAQQFLRRQLRVEQFIVEHGFRVRFGSVTRGGFGSFAHAFSAHFSGEAEAITALRHRGRSEGCDEIGTLRHAEPGARIPARTRIIAFSAVAIIALGDRANSEALECIAELRIRVACRAGRENPPAPYRDRRIKILL